MGKAPALYPAAAAAADSPGRLRRAIAAAGRWRYRHRWHLRPLWLALSAWPLAAAGWVGVGRAENAVWWAVAAGIVLVGIIGKFRISSSRDRAYFMAGSFTGLAWILAASYWLHLAFGLFLWAWVLLTGTGAMMWSLDHRVRSKVRLEKEAEKVPETVTFAGYPELRLLLISDILADDGARTGLRYDFECPRGMHRNGVDQDRLEAAFPGARPGSVTKIDDTGNVRRFSVQVVTADPWKGTGGASKPVPHPAVTHLEQLQQIQARRDAGEGGVAAPTDLELWLPGGSVRTPRTIGQRDDGSKVWYVAWDADHGAHQLLMGGQKGSGKTVTENDLIAVLAPTVDAVIIGIDIAKGGKVFAHWGDVVSLVVTTAYDAVEVTGRVQRFITQRGLDAAAARSHDDKHQPTPQDPAVFLIYEEASALFGRRNGYSADAIRAAEGVAESGREAAVGEWIITQVGDNSSLGYSVRLREQLDDAICLFMKNPEHARFIMGNSKVKVDVSAIQHAGAFYMQNGPKLDGRVNRSYDLHQPADVEALAALYGPRRRHLKDFAQRHFAPTSAAPTTPEGTQPMTDSSPTPAGGLFDKPGRASGQPARRPGIRGEIDAAAQELAATINGAGEQIAERLTLPPLPRIGPGDAAHPSGTPAEPADLADPLTARILEYLRDPAGPGTASNAELMQACRDRASGEQPSSATVLRRCNALARGGKLTSEGSGRATRWRAVLEHVS